MYTFEPFFRYCSAIRHRFSLKITTRCHSVFSRRSPVALSRHESDVASRRLAIGRPSWVRRISGSAPRLPIRMTLFTLPAIVYSARLLARDFQRFTSKLRNRDSVSRDRRVSQVTAEPQYWGAKGPQQPRSFSTRACISPKLSAQVLCLF